MLAEGPPGGFREIGDEGPAKVTAALALAGLEPLVPPSLDRADTPAAKTLNRMLLAHVLSVGGERPRKSPRKG